MNLNNSINFTNSFPLEEMPGIVQKQSDKSKLF